MPGYLGAGRCGGVGVVASVRWMSHICSALSLSNRRENSEDVPGVCSRAVGSTSGKLTHDGQGGLLPLPSPPGREDPEGSHVSHAIHPTPLVDWGFGDKHVRQLPWAGKEWGLAESRQ